MSRLRRGEGGGGGGKQTDRLFQSEYTPKIVRSAASAAASPSQRQLSLCQHWHEIRPWTVTVAIDSASVLIRGRRDMFYLNATLT